MTVHRADARHTEHDPFSPGRFPKNIISRKSRQCQEKQCHGIHPHISRLHTENRHQQGKCHKIYRNLPIKQLRHVIFPQEHVSGHEKYR